MAFVDRVAQTIEMRVRHAVGSSRNKRKIVRHAVGYVGSYNERMSGSHEMNPASPRMKLTYDDYLLFPDDGKRHELIDGEHFVTPTPILRHQAIAGRLHLLIATYLKAQPIGRVFFAPLDVILSRFDVVELSRVAGDVLTTALFPELELPLSEIFED